MCTVRVTDKHSFVWLKKSGRWVMPISHRRHGQDKTVLSCPCRRCQHNWRQDKTVLCRLESVSNLQLFSLKYIEDYWKLSWLVANSVHTADMDKTRQFCLVRVDSLVHVLSMSAVWNRHEEYTCNVWCEYFLRSRCAMCIQHTTVCWAVVLDVSLYGVPRRKRSTVFCTQF